MTAGDFAIGRTLLLTVRSWLKAYSMAENPIHASIVLNIHREAVFLRRTLLSLAEAADFARSKGISLELVAVLDRTDDATRQVLLSSDVSIYENVRIIEVDNGSLGLSRNDGISSVPANLFSLPMPMILSHIITFYDILMRARTKGKNYFSFPRTIFGFGRRLFDCSA